MKTIARVPAKAGTQGRGKKKELDFRFRGNERSVVE
jgi:hypothetical protein